MLFVAPLCFDDDDLVLSLSLEDFCMPLDCLAFDCFFASDFSVSLSSLVFDFDFADEDADDFAVALFIALECIASLATTSNFETSNSLRLHFVRFFCVSLQTSNSKQQLSDILRQCLQVIALIIIIAPNSVLILRVVSRNSSANF